MPGQNIRLASASIGLRVDNRRLRRGATQATNELRKVQRRERELARQTRQLTMRFRSFASRLVSVRSIVGTLAGSAGLGLLVRQITEMGRQLGVQIERTGLAANEFRALQSVFAEGGLQADETADAIAAMTERIGEAQDATSEQARLFSILGVRVTDAQGQARGFTEVMSDVADAVANASNETEISTTISALFSTEGERLIGVWRRGGAEFRRLLNHYRQGNVITDEGVQAVTRLGIAANVTGRHFQDVLIESLAPFAGQIEDLLDSTRDLATTYGEDVVGALAVVARNLDVILITLAALGGLGLLASLTRTAAAVFNLSSLFIANRVRVAGGGFFSLLSKSLGRLKFGLVAVLPSLSLVAAALLGGAGIIAAFIKWREETAHLNRVLSGSPRHLDEINEALNRVNERIAEGRDALDGLGQGYARALAGRARTGQFGAGIADSANAEGISRGLREQRDAIETSRRLALARDNLRRRRTRGGTGGQSSRAADRVDAAGLPVTRRFVGPAFGDAEEAIFGARSIQEQAAAQATLFDMETERQEAAYQAEKRLNELRQETLRNQLQGFDLLMTAQDTFINAASSGFAQAILNAEDWRDTIRGILEAVVQQVLQLYIAEQLTTLLSRGVRPGLTPGGASIASGSTGTNVNAGAPGFRQAGGPIGESGFYRVGEAGPETLFLPRGSRVYADGGAGAARGATFNFNISGSDEATVRRGIEAATPSIIQAAEQLVTRNAARPSALSEAIRATASRTR